MPDDGALPENTRDHFAGHQGTNSFRNCQRLPDALLAQCYGIWRGGNSTLEIVSMKRTELITPRSLAASFRLQADLSRQVRLAAEG